MNYCTRCESFYQKAGTCNCYAEKEDAAPDDSNVIRIGPNPNPWVQPYPWAPHPWGDDWWSGGDSITAPDTPYRVYFTNGSDHQDTQTWAPIADS